MVDQISEFESLKSFLRKEVLKRLKMDPSNLTDDTNLVGCGLQSIDAVLISGEVEERYDVELEPILLFEKRTVNEATAYIWELLKG